MLKLIANGTVLAFENRTGRTRKLERAVFRCSGSSRVSAVAPAVLLWGCLAAWWVLGLAAQAQVYKWTDGEGRVHYSNTAPPADAPSPQTLDVPSQPTPTGKVDNVRDLQRATRELRELRALNRGVPVGELDRPLAGRKAGKAKEPPYIGYEDRARIDNLNSVIRRLAASTLGTSASRARELRALKDELRQIYQKYGIKYR